MKTTKLTTVFFMALTVLGLGSCSKTEKSVSGIILDATMNTMMISGPKGDTLTFSTLNAERISPEGILIGDSATVFYTGKLMTQPGGEITSAVRVVVTHLHRDSEKLVGSWVEPVPGMPGQLQGFLLQDNGTAESINMATLKYQSWASEGESTCADASRLILRGQSIGNDQTIEFADTLKIDKLTPDSLVLSGSDGYTVRYARAK